MANMLFESPANMHEGTQSPVGAVVLVVSKVVDDGFGVCSPSLVVLTSVVALVVNGAVVVIS